MDFQSSTYVNETINCQLVKSMALKYCLNVMRKRTVDEQLRDFSNIFGVPLKLMITYQKAEVEVKYTIGSENATVKGSNESTCVFECKRNILNHLKVFCKYSNNAKEICQSEDIYSDIKSESVKNGASSSNEVLSIDQDTDRVELCGIRPLNTEICDLLDMTKTPLILMINYFQTDVEITYEVASHRVSIRSPTKSTCMYSCKIKLLRLLRSILTHSDGTADGSIATDREAVIPNPSEPEDEITEHELNRDEEPMNCPGELFGSVVGTSYSSENATEVESVESTVVDVPSIGTAQNNVVRDEPCNVDNRCNSPSRTTTYMVDSSAKDAIVKTPSPTKVSATSSLASSGLENKLFDELEEHEMFVQRTSAVLNKVTEHKMSKYTDALLDVLVHAHQVDRSYIGLITDVIVKTVSRNPNTSGLYASLCSDTAAKASANPGLADVRDMFRDEMKMSCNSVLSDLPRTYDPTATCGVNKKVRVRTLETCRFMGRLFMLNNFKMSHTVKKTVNDLLKSRDSHCLKCLCALLRIIGPRFEMVDEVSKHCSAGKVYKTLEEYAVDGTQPDRTVRRINRIICERNVNWLPRKPSSPK